MGVIGGAKRSVFVIFNHENVSLWSKKHHCALILFAKFLVNFYNSGPLSYNPCYTTYSTGVFSDIYETSISSLEMSNNPTRGGPIKHDSKPPSVESNDSEDRLVISFKDSKST